MKEHEGARDHQAGPSHTLKTLPFGCSGDLWKSNQASGFQMQVQMREMWMLLKELPGPKHRPRPSRLHLLKPRDV